MPRSTATASGGTPMATRKKTTAGTKKAPAAKRPARRASKAPRARTAPQGLTLSSAAPSLTVNDLEQSIAWYRDVLGLDDWKKGRDRVKGEGFRLYCQTAQDADRLAEQIEARGGTLAQEPKDESWGARVFSVEDPDGYKISIFQMRRRP